MTTTVSQKRRRKDKAALADDTPRAFQRLLNYTLKGRRPPSGLDDNPEPPSKKRKRITEISASRSLPADRSSQTVSSLPEPPKILPYEPLSTFAARVDAALPIVGLARSKPRGGVEIQGVRQTKLERKMQRMQQEWRENDRKRRERAEEEDDINVIEDDEMGVSGAIDTSRRAGHMGNAKAKKKKKNRGNHQPAQSDLEEADPWAAVARKRAELTTHPTSTGRGRGLVGLHDVVLAPPKLSGMPRAKIRAGVGRPGTESGHGAQPFVPGLRRQAELSAARREVVEGYRRMMRERRGEGE